jgi:exodeoxyribonuclease VII large subunit
VNGRRRDGRPPSQSLGELELFTPDPPPRRAETPRPPSRAARQVPPPPPRVPIVEEVVPGASAAAAVSVMALTATARDVLEGAFPPLWVRGEVTDFKAHRNGHWYFCLRDGDAQVRCVAWARDRRIPASPDDGMQVAAFGQLTVYPARGEMQFSVTRMDAEGDGLYRKALELTRARLEADGLLDPRRKRRIPRYPRRIAVITSRDGAALRDIYAVVQRRCPAVQVVLVPAAVQGDAAPESLCYALDQVTRWGKADALIIGRGGGGREDLWAFNDERVARALAACPIPTISAVGHEIDMSICDLVADLRAPTPSAAAEAAVPVQLELRERVRLLSDAMGLLSADRLARARSQASGAADELSTAVVRHVEHGRRDLEAAGGRLNALSPLATLDRGFSIARDRAGKTIRSVRALAPGAEIDIVLRDGVAAVKVEATAATPSAAADGGVA